MRRRTQFRVEKALLSNGAWLKLVGKPNGVVPTAESCPFSSRATRTTMSNERMDRQMLGVVFRAGLSTVIPSQ